MSEKIAAKLAGTSARYTPPRCHDWVDHVYQQVPLDQCRHAASFHETSGADLFENARYFGLRMNKAGAYEFKKEPKLSTSGVKIPDRTAENIAACAAVGLSYWSEAPGINRLWAVDDQREAHEIRIDRKRGTAVTAYNNTAQGYRTVTGSWVKPADTEQVFALLDVPPVVAEAA